MFSTSLAVSKKIETDAYIYISTYTSDAEWSITIQTMCIDEEMLVLLSMTIIFCLNSHVDVIKLNRNRWYGENDELDVVF